MAHGEEDLDKWNPMVEDYEDRSFNSYDRGPGRNMPDDPKERKNYTNLYVRGIPPGLKEQGIRNMFGSHGRVLSCKIRSTPNYATNIAFIMMETVEQCSQCIRHLNGYKIAGCKIIVEFAKSEEDKAKDRLERQAEDDFIKTLANGRTVTSVRDQERDGNVENLQISFNNDKEGSRQSGGEEHPNTPTSEGLKGCEQCGKSGSRYKCGHCQANYCSKECQARNWGVHKAVCKLRKQTGSNQGQKERSGSVSSGHSSIPPSGVSKGLTKPLTNGTSVHSPKPAPSAKITLPLNKPVQVTLVEFQSPGKFFVQLTRNNEVHLLNTALDQLCLPCPTIKLYPCPGDLLAVQLPNGIWQRGLIIAPRDDHYYVYLVDIGQKHMAKYVCPIPPNIEDIPFQAIECSLYGLIPYRGSTWSDFSVQVSTKNGLTTGAQYTLTCVNSDDRNQVLLKLEDGSDLGDCLINETGALPDPHSKYRVWDSLHRYLKPGDNVALLVDEDSIEGVNGFYAQTANEKLASYIVAYHEIEARLNIYCQNNQLAVEHKSEVGDFVLCEFEGCWYRGEICQTQNEKAVVGFIDYGNLAAKPLTELLPLPREFSHMPAIAAKICLEGIADFETPEIKEQAATRLKELILTKNGSPVRAVVKDRSMDTLSVGITLPSGETVSNALLAAGLAVKDVEPLPGSFKLQVMESQSDISLSSETTQSPVPIRPPSTAPSVVTSPTTTPPIAQHKVSSHNKPAPSASGNSFSNNNHSNQQNQRFTSPSTTRSPQVAKVSHPPRKPVVESLLTIGSEYTVRLRKLDSTSTFCVNFPTNMPRVVDALSKEISQFYQNSEALKIVKPNIGDFIVFQNSNNDWRRGCVRKVSSQNQIALTRHLDYERETTKVPFNMLREMHPQFASIPCQALPVCQMQNITDPEVKINTLKPYMQSALQMKVIQEVHGVYTVNLKCEGKVLEPSTGEKWMVDKNVHFTKLPTGPFKVNVLEVVSPLDIHITPAVQKDIAHCLKVVASEGVKVHKEAPPTSVEPGEVLLLFSESYNEWDRVIVLERVDSKQVSVKSGDYGAISIEPLSNMRNLTEEASKVPLRAVKCSLAGVGEDTTEEARATVMKLKTGTLTAEVVEERSDRITCTLVDLNGVNINSTLTTGATSGHENPGGEEAHAPDHRGDAGAPQQPPAGNDDEHLAKLDERLARLEELVSALSVEIPLLRAEKDRLTKERASK